MNCIHCRISRVQCVQSSKPNICERCLKHGRKPEECAVKATMYELLETYSKHQTEQNGGGGRRGGQLSQG